MLNTYKAILSQRTQLNSDTYLYRFDLVEPKEINFKAGQYLMIKVPSDKGPISRLYSIASSTFEKNHFEFIVQIIPGGLASNYLSNLKIKDEVTFQGPAGLFGLKENERQKIFLATGTGIAPIKSMLKTGVKNYQLFWGLKTYKDAYLLDELKEFKLKICLSREQNLDMIPELDRKYFGLGHVDYNCPLITTADYYLCGGREIVEALKKSLLAKNIPLENIHFEKF